MREAPQDSSVLNLGEGGPGGQCDKDGDSDSGRVFGGGRNGLGGP